MSCASRRSRIEFTDQQLLRMSAMYAEGKGLVHISGVFGISTTAVSARLKASNQPIRGRGRPKKVTAEIVDLIFFMRAGERSWADIASATGLSIGHMHHLLSCREHSNQNPGSEGQA